MVSVVIPVYNRQNTIRNSILSVLDQVGFDLEIIVVDDFSTDNTKEEVLSINDDRVKYFKLTKNSGACVARNYGIQKSKGEYIAFQDSDDIWLPNKLEKQINKLKEVNTDIISCSMIANNGEMTWFVPNITNIYNRFINIQDVLRHSFISTQTILAKRKVFDLNLFDKNMPRMQDWDFILRAVQNSKLYFMEDRLVEQFIQNDSITSNPQKGIIALDLIYVKYRNLFDNDKIALSNLWDNYLYLLTLKKEYNKMPKIAFKSLKANFKIKRLFKYLLTIVRVYKPK